MNTPAEGKDVLVGGYVNEIEIPEEDLPTLKTVGDVVKYVEVHKE